MAVPSVSGSNERDRIAPKSAVSGGDFEAVDAGVADGASVTEKPIEFAGGQLRLKKKPLKTAASSGAKMDAGTGFEPVTFRL